MNKRYHLIGIGGIGMSGIAQLLLGKGFQVSGSDVKETRITRELKRSGAVVSIGHSAENIRGADTVVYSSAIKEENPEMQEAKKRGVPILKRAQALAELMQEKRVITVAGSHGKTTTASLASFLLLEADLKPCVAVGGILKNIDANSYLGSGQFFVAEADESDGSFLYYRPAYSIITNIDKEHLDYYKDFDKELEAFKSFLNKTEKDGCVFYCDDDVYLKRMFKGYKNRFVSFGLKDSAHVYARNIEFIGLVSQFDCFFKDRSLGRFELALGGRHNISNALSVIALGMELGIDLKFIKGALKDYQGARRRLELKFYDSDYSIMDDYAHHPTEIRATLKALRNLGRKKIIAIFQPHRYSRTKSLLDEFGKSFDNADAVILTDIYPANEIPIPGITARCVLDKIKQHAPQKDVLLLPKEQIGAYVLRIIRSGDLVVTLGAGDIFKVSDYLSENFASFRNKHKHGSQ
jgi:UDP-N-acetylmuramate--alanine ligase